MGDDTDEPTERLEPIAYLSRSENRVQVLEALTETITMPGQDTPGYDPRELREVTGASEATVSRILNEFDERGWAERDLEGEYTATPVGQSIAIGFEPLLDSMEAIQHLDEAVALLPLNELTIGLQHFSDATVREPEGPPHIWYPQYEMPLLEDSSRRYVLSYTPFAPSGEADIGAYLAERVKRGTLDLIQIWPRTIHDHAHEAFGGETPREIIEAGGQYFAYDGHMPCNLTVFDETVVIENSQVDGLRHGTVIESQNGVVREWALDVIERYREESEEVTVEDLPE